MSDELSPDEEPLVDGHSRPHLPRIVTAAPIGTVVIVLALFMTVWSFVHFGHAANGANDDDMQELFQSLQIIGPALWIIVAMWGANQIATGLDRATLADRLDGQDAVLHRIESQITTQGPSKQEVKQKSRSFWDRIRSDPN